MVRAAPVSCGSKLWPGVGAVHRVLAAVLVPSRRLRGWIKAMLAKHLLRHRYDYRSEWLRFTRTIAHSGADQARLPLEERIIRAMADITGSPAGALLALGDRGQLELAARWHWPSLDVPAQALSALAVRVLEASGHIADLDELRAGRAAMAPGFAVPPWLIDDQRAWALVPLLHFERLVGLVVLARPAQNRALDREDFDLLRVVGQQLASYLAEHASQEALVEATRFDDFNRRIAFVIHDLKNLACQLSLLAQNADQHAEKPEFISDMMVTLRHSSQKLTAMLARLSRYGGTTIEALAAVRADDVAAKVVAQFEGLHPVILIEAEACAVYAAQESLEQVLAHLVQNAVDATDSELPVFVRVRPDGLSGVIEVLDSGIGMSPEFIRNRLFRPFDSTKPGGFGIGAYEARELVRAMNGRLDVESREGLGSRFTIRLPLSEAAQVLKSLAGRKVA
ncbi:MAG: system histidine kinase PrsK [Pseudomonadota bacterium]